MIPYGRHHIDEDDIAAVVDLLRNGMLTQGPAVTAFEKAVADYVGATYAVAVSSGTAALHLAALTAGVGPGNSLVTSPITFVASANASRFVGGDVLFADIDPHTANLSPASLRQILNANDSVRAVVPVHFAGLPCDMSAIKQDCDQAGALVIEDAAHAFGARYPDGGMVGNCAYSAMTVFSFHPVKAIAAGEGGMVTTNDETLFRRLLRLRSHGINKLDDPFLVPEQAGPLNAPDPWYYEMQELGFNFRITDIQCALALSQLKKIDRFISRRNELCLRYDRAFENLAHAGPIQRQGREISAHHLYVLGIDFAALGKSRGQVIRELQQHGIGSQVHYIPVPAQPYYRELGFRPEDYPNALSYYERALSIPLYYDLSDHEQDRVIRAISELSE